MLEKAPTNSPEKKEIIDDNARKFIVNAIDPKFLEENRATSFNLITDWLEIGDDDEKKVAYKEFENGNIQTLLIAKITKNGDRTSEKEKITEDKYEELLSSSMLHLEKKRSEFTYTQNGTAFSVKYDEFAESKLCILEVDAINEEERNSFSPGDFPGELTEVTGDIRYYGYRVAIVV
jgi:hypothetical protein